ncbi:cis-Golgi t-SNARE syntaxin [Pichia californica]|nr:cis-Golgi t-SNARE syntaxin [[Candida] californica]
MKSFLHEKSRLLSPEPRICVSNASEAFAQLTNSKNAASDIALSPSTDGSYNHYSNHNTHNDIHNDININNNNNYNNNIHEFCDDWESKSNNAYTNFRESSNGSGLGSRSTSMATGHLQESNLENLKKVDLNYLTLFRRSARFSNKGFSHFFLSQELKCDDYSLPIYNSDVNNINNSIDGIDNINHDDSSHNRDPSRGSHKKIIAPGISNSNSNSTSHAIYDMVFSHDGKYLASAGADGLIRIWEVITSEMDRHTNHKNINSNSSQMLNIPVKQHRKSFIENAFDDTINDISSILNVSSPTEQKTKSSSKSRRNTLDSNDTSLTNDSNPHSYQHSKNSEFAPVFKSKPIKTFYHNKTVNSLDWSKNNFLLSSSEDGTAKLWHVDRADCLQTYKFDSIVTCAKFHKSDDRFFAACQWNGRVVFLSILEKEVIYEINLKRAIMCFDFSPDSTRMFVGCDKGYIVSIKIDKGLSIETDYQIKKKHKQTMPTVTGISTFIEDNIEWANSTKTSTKFNHLSHSKSSTNDNNGINNTENHQKSIKLLVSCSDSKIRLFNFTEKFLEVRYSGHTNKNSSISATVNENHTHVISGSDDGWTYIWQLYSDKKNKIEKEKKLMTKAHFDILTYFKDDTCLIDNKYYGSFHTHNNRCNVAIFAPRASLKLLELSNDPIFDLKHQYSSLLGESNVKDLEIDDLSSAIIVSTDNTGKIKIFRRDFSRYIRKVIQSKKGTQILERKQSILSRNLSKKVLNRNSLIVPTYEANGHNIADTMASVYLEADANARGRGKKGFVRPANKFAVESTLPNSHSVSNNIPIINIEKQSHEWNKNNRSDIMTSTPESSTINQLPDNSVFEDQNNSTLRVVSNSNINGNNTELNSEYNKRGNILEVHSSTLPITNTTHGSSSSSSSSSYSTESSIQVSNSIKNIDDEIRHALMGTSLVGVVHKIGQKQHSQESSINTESPHKVKGNVYIDQTKRESKPGGIKQSQVVTIPLDTDDHMDRAAEGIQDRTFEFQQAVNTFSKQDRKNNIKTIPVNNTNSNNDNAKSEFNRKAGQIAKEIVSVTGSLTKLAQLTKRKQLFGDKPADIVQLTYIIKQDIFRIEKELKDLKSVQVSDQRGKNSNSSSDQQLNMYNKNVVQLLNTKTKNISENFKEVLQARQKTEMLQRSRQEQLLAAVKSGSTVGNVGGEINNEAVPYAVRTASKNKFSSSNIGNSSASDNPFLASMDFGNNGDLKNNGGVISDSENGAMLSLPDQTQQLLLLEEQNSQYVQERSSAVEAIESTINEVGNLFQQLSTMVQEQGEVIQRIDDNVEDVSLNISGVTTATPAALRNVRAEDYSSFEDFKKNLLAMNNIFLKEVENKILEHDRVFKESISYYETKYNEFKEENTRLQTRIMELQRMIEPLSDMMKDTVREFVRNRESIDNALQLDLEDLGDTSPLQFNGNTSSIEPLAIQRRHLIEENADNSSTRNAAGITARSTNRSSRVRRVPRTELPESLLQPYKIDKSMTFKKFLDDWFGGCVETGGIPIMSMKDLYPGWSSRNRPVQKYSRIGKCLMEIFGDLKEQNERDKVLEVILECRRRHETDKKFWVDVLSSPRRVVTFFENGIARTRGEGLDTGSQRRLAFCEILRECL